MRRRSQSLPCFKARLVDVGPVRASNRSPTWPSSQLSAGAPTVKNNHRRNRLEKNAHMVLSLRSDPRYRTVAGALRPAGRKPSATIATASARCSQLSAVLTGTKLAGLSRSMTSP